MMASKVQKDGFSMGCSGSKGSGPSKSPMVRRVISLFLGLILLPCLGMEAHAQWSWGLRPGVDFPLVHHQDLDGYYQSLGAFSLSSDLHFQGPSSNWGPRLQVQTSWIQVPADHLPPLVAVLHYMRTDFRFSLLRRETWKGGQISYGGGLGASLIRSRFASFDRNSQGAYQLDILNPSQNWIPHLHAELSYRQPLASIPRLWWEAGIHLSYGFLFDDTEPTPLRVTHPSGASSLGAVALKGHLIQPGFFLGLRFPFGQDRF